MTYVCAITNKRETGEPMMPWFYIAPNGRLILEKDKAYRCDTIAEATHELNKWFARTGSSRKLVASQIQGDNGK